MKKVLEKGRAIRRPHQVKLKTPKIRLLRDPANVPKGLQDSDRNM